MNRFAVAAGSALFLALGCIGANSGVPSSSPGPSPSPVISPGTGVYLDRCTAPGDCASTICEDDVGGTQFCTRGCSSHGDCAHEHICADSVCKPDDTGRPCTAANNNCALGSCLISGDGTGACVRDCTTAADCGAGYACSRVAGDPIKRCVDIEKSCTDGNNCGTGLCLSIQGCTATCDTAADCPARLPFLPAYTCEIAFGSSSPICVPPADILGPDPIGAACSAVGQVDCRSGACDTTATLGPMCTQSCSELGGCGPGLGCFPLSDGGGGFDLVCNRGGTGDLGDPCLEAAQCDSGLCDAAGFCTRHCKDGLCPTGMTCQPVAGTTFAFCRL